MATKTVQTLGKCRSWKEFFSRESNMRVLWAWRTTGLQKGQYGNPEFNTTSRIVERRLLLRYNIVCVYRTRVSQPVNLCVRACGHGFYPTPRVPYRNTDISFSILRPRASWCPPRLFFVTELPRAFQIKQTQQTNKSKESGFQIDSTPGFSKLLRQRAT